MAVEPTDGPVIVQDELFVPEMQKLVTDRGYRVVLDLKFSTPHPDAVGAIVFGHPPFGAAQAKNYPSLKCVSNFGVGYDHVNVEELSELGLLVGNTPGAVDSATADLTFALLLATARNVVAGDRIAKSPSFTAIDMNWFGTMVSGGTLGILGLGRIGKLVARRASGFDMKVIYHNRTRLPSEEEAALGVTYADSFTALLSEADFVVLAVPSSPATRRIMDEPQFRAMKPTAHLINIGRGMLVNQDALLKALTEGWIKGAAVDVTDPEPLPRGHPLLGLDNLIITPHIGSATLATRTHMLEMALDNLDAGLAGTPLPTGLNNQLIKKE